MMKKAFSQAMSLSWTTFFDCLRRILPLTVSSSKSSSESTRSRSFFACELLCVIRFFTNPVTGAVVDLRYPLDKSWFDLWPEKVLIEFDFSSICTGGNLNKDPRLVTNLLNPIVCCFNRGGSLEVSLLDGLVTECFNFYVEVEAWLDGVSGIERLDFNF